MGRVESDWLTSASERDSSSMYKYRCKLKASVVRN